MIKKTVFRVKKELINAVYLATIFCLCRYQLFFGGASSGKSYYLAQRCVIDLLGGNRNYLIVRKVAKTIRKSVFNEITKVIINWNLSKYFDINKSEMTITHKLNKKQILFSGLDNREKLKSITPQDGVITDIWIEEATEIDFHDFKQLEKRLRGKSVAKKRIILSFNPVHKLHWIYIHFFAGRWIDGKNIYEGEDIHILKTTYRDNDFLEPDDIKALMEETDKYYFDVYTEGNWGVLGAVIFKNWKVQDLSNIKQTFDNRRFALDFGFAEDPAFLGCIHFDRKRKRIYIYDELVRHGMTNQQIAPLVKEKIGNSILVCDSAEPKSIRELQLEGLRAIGAKKGPDSVNHGIQWLRGYEIIIDPKCKFSIHNFTLYKWKEDKDGNVLPIPVDKHNHAPDVLRYALESDMLIKDNEKLEMHTMPGTPSLPAWCV